MSKKSEFIEYVKKLIELTNEEMTSEALAYWEALQIEKEENKPMFTDNGKLIMKYLQTLPEDTAPLKAKDIADEMFLSSRTVSGAMRKLTMDGFVEKVGKDPTLYILTDKGRNIDMEAY